MSRSSIYLGTVVLTKPDLRKLAFCMILYPTVPIDHIMTIWALIMSRAKTSGGLCCFRTTVQLYNCRRRHDGTKDWEEVGNYQRSPSFCQGPCMLSSTTVTFMCVKVEYSSTPLDQPAAMWQARDLTKSRCPCGWSGSDDPDCIVVSHANARRGAARSAASVSWACQWQPRSQDPGHGEGMSQRTKGGYHIA